MALRLLPLLPGLALCGIAHAAAAQRIDLDATAAWQGWSRPGRTTEVDVRIGASQPTRAAVGLAAGPQRVHSDVELQPGRPVLLHLPMPAAERIAVDVVAADGQRLQREVSISHSESPLLGAALASDARVELTGFHTVVLAADDLPRNAAAYASVDAMLLDAPTLAALDPEQLAALLAHASACGRIAVASADAGVRRLLEGAAGCGARALMNAASVPQALALLEASFASGAAPSAALGANGALARSEHRVWNRVTVMLAVYAAAAVLLVLASATLPALLLMPAATAIVVLALLQLMPMPARLTVWSEAESGARVARYQAWQQYTGLVRGSRRVPIPPPLASSVHSCLADQPVGLDFDAGRGRMRSAVFETRLFGEVGLCSAGAFPIARAFATAPRADGSLEVRNIGPAGWPAGALLADGRVRDLPALAPGGRASVGAGTALQLPAAVVRMARSRMQLGGVAALWALDLAGVADAPADSTGWLLVTVPQR